MRNLGFAAAIGVAIVTGVCIGGGLDLSIAHPALGAKTRFTLPVFNRFEAKGETSTPAEHSRLDFNIDATKGDERDAASYRPSPRDMGLLSTSSCVLPTAGERKLVVFSVYEGDAISTVALGNRDVETTTIEIEIEAGDEPLYVVLSAYDNMVWRFSGATSRVEKLVLLAADGAVASSRRTATLQDAERAAVAAAQIAGRHRQSSAVALSERPFAGVTGIASDVITTRNPGSCFGYFSDPESIQATRAGDVIRRATGRTPDVIAAHYSVGAVKLPSGRAARGDWPGRSPDGFDQGMWRELLRFHPGGLSKIDPDQVLSDVKVESYDVLPQQAGLAQLIGSGQIVRLSDGLRIDKPIARFPAGLNGAHSVPFLLGAGVPLPAGDPGHSCVIDEDTGQTVQDRRLC